MKDILLILVDNIKIFITYSLVFNMIGFSIFGIDKKRAVGNKWRIPEATLITIAFLGGGIGSLIGMKIFHHKTKKAKFYVGIPAIIILHITLLILGVLLIL